MTRPKPVKVTRYPNSLPPCVPIDCSKQKWAHLKTTERKFITLTPKGR